MTGQQLYEIYANVYDEDGVGVEAWEDMEAEEQGRWERMAQQVK